MVWFINKEGKHLNGNLGDFLKKGITLDEISNGLERIYAGEEAKWVLEKIPGKFYLPETDMFDTWFSSGNDQPFFGKMDSDDFSYFYPCNSVIIGYDLLRLSVSREIFLSLYTTKKMPFNLVYLHALLRGPDGQKMSKSLGNVMSIEYYLEKFGADVTRMALVSYTASAEDFYFSEDSLKFFQDFGHRLWEMGRFINVINEYNINLPKNATLSPEDEKILLEMNNLARTTGTSVEKYMFAFAQEKVCNFLALLEKYIEAMKSEGDAETSMSLMLQIYEKYLIVLHPFMPFLTEELYGILYKKSLLANARWPQAKKR